MPGSEGNSSVPLLVDFLLADSSYFFFLLLISFLLLLIVLLFDLSLLLFRPYIFHCPSMFPIPSQVVTVLTKAALSVLCGSSLHACCSLIPSWIALILLDDRICWRQRLLGGPPRSCSYQLYDIHNSCEWQEGFAYVVLRREEKHNRNSDIFRYWRSLWLFSQYWMV